MKNVVLFGYSDDEATEFARKQGFLRHFLRCVYVSAKPLSLGEEEPAMNEKDAYITMQHDAGGTVIHDFESHFPFSVIETNKRRTGACPAFCF